MMDLETRFMELGMQGFACSQILMELALEMEGTENSDLIRAMGGLTCGMGQCGKCCGALSGGAAVLGYYTCRGEEEEMEHSDSRIMIAEYVNWFEQRFGTTLCQDILEGDFSRTMQVCTPLVIECFEKIIEILSEYGVLE